MAAVSAAPDSGEAIALRDLNALAAYGGRRFLVCGTLQFIYPRALVERRRGSAASIVSIIPTWPSKTAYRPL
jgi:hypothetical protein